MGVGWVLTCYCGYLPLAFFGLMSRQNSTMQDEAVQFVLDNVDHPDPLREFRREVRSWTNDTFVLNEREFSEEVLTRNFIGRLVEVDLARSLSWWPEDHGETDDMT